MSRFRERIAKAEAKKLHLAAAKLDGKAGETAGKRASRFREAAATTAKGMQDALRASSRMEDESAEETAAPRRGDADRSRSKRDRESSSERSARQDQDARAKREKRRTSRAAKDA